MEYDKQDRQSFTPKEVKLKYDLASQNATEVVLDFPQPEEGVKNVVGFWLSAAAKKEFRKSTQVFIYEVVNSEDHLIHVFDWTNFKSVDYPYSIGKKLKFTVKDSDNKLSESYTVQLDVV